MFGLDTAVSGLLANQRALEVTGHNVSNLGSAGYARQRADITTATTRIYGNWHVEMGASVEQISQIRDMFLDNVYRTQNNALGYWDTRNKAITELQDILGEPMQDGLQSSLNNFWDSWQELTKSPESLTVRAMVKQRADTLINLIGQMDSQINKLQKDLNNEIKVQIENVNSITGQIAELNTKIMSAEAIGNNPNDYIDQRNVLADKLSSLVKTEFWEGPDGNMDVLVNGYYLVNRGKQTKLVADSNDTLSSFYTPKLEESGTVIDVGQGVIKGLLESRGEVSGDVSSYSNGSPNTTAQVIVAVDTSNYDMTHDFKGWIEAELEKWGLDYDDVEVVTYNSTNFANFINNDVIGAAPFKEGANKYLMVLSSGSSPATVAQAEALAENGITAFVVNGTNAWDSFAEITGGSVLEPVANNADEVSALCTTLSKAVNQDINKKISNIPEDLNIISSLKKQLNALVNVMARELNYLHQSGYTLDGEEGESFFSPVNSTLPLQMGNITINPNMTNFNKIVASAIDANGDNTIALAIATLRSEGLITGNDKVVTLDTYYQNIIMDIGNKGYEAETMKTSHEKLVNQAESMRQTIMGVSLDEEMTQMIKFKYAYNANSKVINTVNEMLETIINRMGAA